MALKIEHPDLGGKQMYYSMAFRKPEIHLSDSLFMQHFSMPENGSFMIFNLSLLVIHLLSLHSMNTQCQCTLLHCHLKHPLCSNNLGYKSNLITIMHISFLQGKSKYNIMMSSRHFIQNSFLHQKETSQMFNNSYHWTDRLNRSVLTSNWDTSNMSAKSLHLQCR